MKLRYVESVHGYWLSDEHGKMKRCKGVTTVAKIGTDTYSLEQWQRRQVLLGLASAPRLIDRVIDGYARTNSDLDAICDDAKEAAGGNKAAQAGTAAHEVTERHDRGEETEGPHSHLWEGALASAGLILVPELSERIVVHPDQLICGRFDRFLLRASDGMMAIADLKTGSLHYPHAIAAQLAMYARAPLMAGELNDKGETEHFTPLPPTLDQNTGYIIHMPDDGEVAVYACNLKLGWQAVENVIFPALRWRATPNASLIKPVGR